MPRVLRNSINTPNPTTRWQYHHIQPYRLSPPTTSAKPSHQSPYLPTYDENKSLLSVRQLCDHDCMAVFIANHIRITCNDHTILKGDTISKKVRFSCHLSCESHVDEPCNNRQTQCKLTAGPHKIAQQSNEMLFLAPLQYSLPLF